MKDRDELLSAWADDPRSLTPEERAEVEALVAEEPALAQDADDTRALLAKLRRLPGEGEEPAWDGFARQLREQIDAQPDRWFRRWLARWWKPAFGLGLALTAAAIVIAMSGTRERTPAKPVANLAPDAAVPAPAPEHPVPVVPPRDAPEDPLALGTEGEIPADDLDDEAADEVAVALGEDPDDADDPDGLVPDLSLDFVDDLDDAQLDRLDAALARN